MVTRQLSLVLNRPPDAQMRAQGRAFERRRRGTSGQSPQRADVGGRVSGGGVLGKSVCSQGSVGTSRGSQPVGLDGVNA